MTGSQQPIYRWIDEYQAEHRADLTKIRSVLMDCMISSAEVNNGDLRLNYADGNVDIIQREEFIPRQGGTQIPDSITTSPFKVVVKVAGGEMVVDSQTDEVVTTVYDRCDEAEIKMERDTFKEFVIAIRDLRI